MTRQTKRAPLAQRRGPVHLFDAMITPEQCRAARAWLDIGQRELAAEAGVSDVTIRKFERGEGSQMLGTVTLIHLAVERLGFALPDDDTLLRKP